MGDLKEEICSTSLYYSDSNVEIMYQSPYFLAKYFTFQGNFKEIIGSSSLNSDAAQIENNLFISEFLKLTLNNIATVIWMQNIKGHTQISSTLTNEYSTKLNLSLGQTTKLNNRIFILVHPVETTDDSVFLVRVIISNNASSSPAVNFDNGFINRKNLAQILRKIIYTHLIHTFFHLNTNSSGSPAYPYVFNAVYCIIYSYVGAWKEVNL